MKNKFFLLIFIFNFSCSSVKFTNDYLTADSKKLDLNFNLDNKKNWQNLDLELDSVPGMSVDRAYNELLKGLNPNKVIVAVIDSGIDLSLIHI